MVPLSLQTPASQCQTVNALILITEIEKLQASVLLTFHAEIMTLLYLTDYSGILPLLLKIRSR
jgi:hypothetical protein